MKFQCRLTARNLIASEQTARKMAFCLARDDDRLSDSAPENRVDWKSKKVERYFWWITCSSSPEPFDGTTFFCLTCFQHRQRFNHFDWFFISVSNIKIKLPKQHLTNHSLISFSEKNVRFIDQSMEYEKKSKNKTRVESEIENCIFKYQLSKIVYPVGY